MTLLECQLKFTSEKNKPNKISIYKLLQIHILKEFFICVKVLLKLFF